MATLETSNIVGMKEAAESANVFGNSIFRLEREVNKQRKKMPRLAKHPELKKGDAKKKKS